jgi:uncharacterized protein YndB with AHSA1/START domain
MPLAPVVKQITIETSAARAFRVFTEDIGAWWPLATHHIGAHPPETAVIEPRVGGRWFERAADGAECPWGRVLVWDPPARLVLSWQVGGGWKYDGAMESEVEVRFVALGPALTRVELEHRKLDALGPAAEGMRAAFDSEGGWTGILRLFGGRAVSP